MRRRTEHGLPDRAKREWNMRFNSTFYSVGRGLGPDPQRWRALFDAYDPSAWQQDQSGALQFMTEDRTRYNLILERDGDSFSVSYQVTSRQDASRNRALFCLGDATAMNVFDSLPSLARVPRGSFLGPDRVAAIVAEFLSDPTVPPPSVEWVDAEALDWPEG